MSPTQNANYHRSSNRRRARQDSRPAFLAVISRKSAQTSVNTKSLLPFLLATLVWAATPVALHGGQADGQLRVMTYNVNEGTDYIEILNARTVPEVLIAVGETITQVRATNPPERMPAVAAKILAANPTLVTLQEVDRWYTGTFNPITQTCSGMTLEFDMVQELLNALAAQGGHYQVAVQALEVAFPPTPGLILPSTFICVAVQNYNMILVTIGSSTEYSHLDQPPVCILHQHRLSQFSDRRDTSYQELGVD